MDWMIHEMNSQGLFNGGVTVVQPLEHGMLDTMKEQDYLYTLLLRGVQSGSLQVKKEIIHVIHRGINVYSQFEDYLEESKNPHLRVIISNTTEAGILLNREDRPGDKPPLSFPGKLLCLP
jgi:tagaturonate reductase